MKKINFMKAMMMAVISISAMTFASCSDDDDDNNKTSSLKFNSAKVEVAPKAAATVTVSNGTAPFTVNSSNTKIATATVKDKTITITGVADGTATVRVTDKNKLAGDVAVTVKTAAKKK